MTEAEAETELSCEHPVIGIVGLRVETVAQAVGSHLEGQAYRLGDVGFQTKTSSNVMGKTILVPSQRCVNGWISGAQIVQLVVVPRVGKSESADEDEVERSRIVLAEEVADVDKQVGVSSDIVPFVVLVEGVESTFRLPAIDMKTQSYGREEIMSERERRSRHQEFVDGSIGRGEMHTTLCLDERVGL